MTDDLGDREAVEKHSEQANVPMVDKPPDERKSFDDAKAWPMDAGKAWRWAPLGIQLRVASSHSCASWLCESAPTREVRASPLTNSVSVGVPRTP